MLDNENEPPQCMYCLESNPINQHIIPPLPPFSSSSSSLLHLGCNCKGSLGHVHISCKAKFAQYKTATIDSSPRSREYYWTHCEICHGNLTNSHAVLCLARERHWTCLYRQCCNNDDDYDGENSNNGMMMLSSKEMFWKELCMSACFFATVIVKKCKDASNACTVTKSNAVGSNQSSSSNDSNKEEGQFWMESCNMLSSTIQLLQQLTPTPHQLALLWSAEMKFVDCLYYVFQMMMDQCSVSSTSSSSSLAKNESIYREAVALVKRYNLRFESLAISMFRMKKFAQDVCVTTGGKRDAGGSLLLSSEESVEFQLLKKKVVLEMKMANALGGDERHYVSRQLSYQVEFINYDVYGRSEEKRSDK